MSSNLDAYRNRLNEMTDHIYVMNDYYIWINENKEFIEEKINLDKQRISKDKIEGFYMNLDSRIKYIGDTLDEIDEIKDSLVEENQSNHYINFLNRELLNINWSNYNLFNRHRSDDLTNLKESQKLNKEFTGNEYKFLDILKMLLSQGETLENELIGKVSSIKIFGKIQTITNNIVMIGPNGSGKSTFARNLKGKLSNTISIISAQHLLMYENPSKIDVTSNMQEEVRNFQKKSKLGSEDRLSNIINEDFQNLVIALFEEKAERAAEYYNNKESRKESILDQTIEIWESLITHRKLTHNDRYSIYVNTDNDDQYDFNNLSDGEKVIFYFISHVLLAEEGSYILIDEPENHLHLSICIKLWNILEIVRSDCKFIYITHDLDFAVSRNDKTLIWNKFYKAPFTWDFTIIEKDESIPERLLIEIIGNRGDVLFCEGDDMNSLDYKIYSRIFDAYNVIPVSGHENVINYCKSFNSNQNVGRLAAYGIIDGDAWDEAKIEKLQRDNIYVLPFNEIENAICQTVFLEKMIKITIGEPQKIEEFREGLFHYADKEKYRISTEYANNRFNNYLKSNMLKERKNIEDLKKEVSTIIDEGKNELEVYYNKMLENIESDVEDENFDSLITYLNGKKAITNGLGNKMIPEFEKTFIRLIDKDKGFKELVMEEFSDKSLSELNMSKK